MEKRLLNCFMAVFFYFWVFLLTPKMIFAGTLTCSDNLTGKAMISEFAPSSSVEWVELLNADENNSIDLSGCKIVVTQPSGSSLSSVTKTLSGTLPRQGFLTFTLEANSIDNSGGLVRLQNSSGSQTFYAASFGSYTPQQSIHISPSPSAAQAVYSPEGQGSWSIGTPTKGWCNTGWTRCPSISTITNQINSEGVTTNLGSMADYTRATGLYFQKSENGVNIGKIEFLSTINFTDRDALSWMQTLDSSIDMSQKGRIGLDATLIQNLIDTNARLTMYGLTLSNPKILVDGQEDTGSIVSSISYNTSTGELSFTAAHFTVFTAVENTSSSSSTPQPESCSDDVPVGSPYLFRGDTTLTSTTLYFSPIRPVSYYFIAYGLESWDNQYGVSFNPSYNNGVINYTISDLSPDTQYYFKVRGGNGCATGPWSNVLSARTGGSNTSLQRHVSTSSQTITESVSDLDRDVLQKQSFNQEKGTKIQQVEVKTDKEKNIKAKQRHNDINSTKPKPSLLQRIIDFIFRFFRLH